MIVQVELSITIEETLFSNQREHLRCIIKPSRNCLRIS